MCPAIRGDRALLGFHENSESSCPFHVPIVVTSQLPVMPCCRWAGQGSQAIRGPNSQNHGMQLLSDVPQLEKAGVVIRMPAAWQASRPPRAQVTAQIGGKAPSVAISSAPSRRSP
jgi:hypothetical protein